MKKSAQADCVRAFLILFLLLCGHSQLSLRAQTPTATTAPDLVLTGDITGAQHQTYVDVPFAVPAGTHRISVDFQYTGKADRAVLDLGIADPQRFRGASGGNKSHFTIAETDATPSYLPGTIPAGQWHLLISVPNMRAQVVSHYRAEIRFNARSEDASFTAQPLATGKHWYRGDLHMHTAHSDGSCASQSGRRVPARFSSPCRRRPPEAWTSSLSPTTIRIHTTMQCVSYSPTSTSYC